MAQTVSIDTKTAKEILNKLQKLEREVSFLREKLEMEPPYGSDEWWEWSDKKAQEDIKAGRVIGPFSNARDMIKALHSGSKS